MLQDITNDMDSDDELDDTIAQDGTLTDEQVLEYAGMEIPIVYEQEEDGKVKVGSLVGIRPHYPKPKYSVRTQGVRKGILTHKAGRTITSRPLVPVLCLMEADLVDNMGVSAEALALGKAAIDSLNPVAVSPEFVDMVVTEYEERAPIDREFFLPSGEEVEDYADVPPTTVDHSNLPSVEEIMAAITTTVTPTTSPHDDGTITFINTETSTMDEQLAVPQVIPEPAIIEDGTDGVHVFDNLAPEAYESPDALTVTPDLSASADRVDTATEPMAVAGKDSEVVVIDQSGLPVIETTTPPVDPRLVQDGTVIPPL